MGSADWLGLEVGYFGLTVFISRKLENFESPVVLSLSLDLIVASIVLFCGFGFFLSRIALR